MLKPVRGKVDESGACVPFRDAEFPSPFVSGLEYSAPARGLWNIVHIGMLIPQSHQIFICAQGCLRGVVLTAAEMNAASRFSTVAIRENNVLEGDMEDLIIDGVTDILGKLPHKPPAVLIFTSCITFFLRLRSAVCLPHFAREIPRHRICRMLYESDYAQKRAYARPAHAPAALQPA